MKKYPIICLFLVMLAVFVGCKTRTKYIVVDESKNDATITVEPGQYLVVKIKGNPTTGYIWEQSGECKIVRQIKESEFEPESKELLGSPGTRTFIFEIISKGSQKLNLINHRPWEKGKEPIKTFSITIQSK